LETTTIASAQSKSNSLRTTIPASIIRQFGLSKGDQLTWDLEPRDAQIIVVVRPLKSEKGAETALRGTPRKEQKGK